jgi:hypothetical protein
MDVGAEDDEDSDLAELGYDKGTQFTCFTSANVQKLTQKAVGRWCGRARACRRRRRRRGGRVAEWAWSTGGAGLQSYLVQAHTRTGKYN